MAAESNAVQAQRQPWLERHHIPRRAAVTLSPEQAAQLLALRDHEGACIVLDDGRTLYCYRDDDLPSPPLWGTAARRVPMTRWRFARCVMIFAVVLVIVAVGGVRDMLVDMVRPSRA